MCTKHTHRFISQVHLPPPPFFTVFILFLSLPYNSLRLSTFCMILSFLLGYFLLRSSFLFLHFHFLFPSRLSILPPTSVHCFIPFLHSGTQHTECTYRRTKSVYKSPNGYNHSVLLLTWHFNSAPGNNYFCRQCASLELAWVYFVPLQTFQGSASETCRLCRVGRQSWIRWGTSEKCQWRV